jgi:hypothetical protein
VISVTPDQQAVRADGAVRGRVVPVRSTVHAAVTVPRSAEPTTVASFSSDMMSAPDGSTPEDIGLAVAVEVPVSRAPSLARQAAGLRLRRPRVARLYATARSVRRRARPPIPQMGAARGLPTREPRSSPHGTSVATTAHHQGPTEAQPRRLSREPPGEVLSGRRVSEKASWMAQDEGKRRRRGRWRRSATIVVFRAARPRGLCRSHDIRIGEAVRGHGSWLNSPSTLTTAGR